jgi:hypothetical protein
MRFSASQTWAIVGVAALLWLALSVFGLASGGGVSVVLTLSDIIPALLIVGAIYERWLWRWPLLHQTGLVFTPVVIGTWRGELASFWENPTTHERPAMKTVYLAIEQTVTTIAVRLLTDESTSQQIAGSVTRSESGYPAISYNYRNEPDLEFRRGNVSPIHYGGALLKIVGKPASGLEGEYWTDRNSSGQLTFREHCPRIAQTFEEATTLPYGPPRPVGVFPFLGRK